MTGPAVSVVILSYDRVHLLERTLRAFLDPRVADGVPYEIIVVDNHPQRLAEGLVATIAGQLPAPVRYFSDVRRNISLVRNIGIKAAQAPYVAFIDDDEAPLPLWLAELHRCLERTGADACFGPKLPEFEGGGPPEWDPDGWSFRLDFAEPPDTEILMFGRLRRRGKGLGSGNAAFRAATCFAIPEPFSPAFGDGNGEDTHLLFRLAQEGRRFVWCPTAKVCEYMEKDRTKLSYMITRMKRGSQHYAACRIATSPSKTLAWIKVSLLGAAQFTVHAGLFILSGDWLRPIAPKHRIGMAKGLGKLTWRKPIGFIDEHAV